MSWTNALVKSIVIFVGVALFTVYVPSWVVEHEQVAKLDRTAQDLIGSAVWGLGFLGAVWLLWLAQKHHRI